MKILHPSGAITLPGTSPTGKTLWVDSVYGNNSLATRESLSVPFKTLTAAKTAAQSGDTIMVLPGTYSDSDLLENGVNWHFFAGAIVDTTGGTIFDTGASAITSLISGHGEFYADDTVLDCSGGGSYITLEALRMESRDSSCINCGAASGQVQVKMWDSIKAPSGVALEFQGSAEGHVIEAQTIESGSYSIHGGDGGAYVKAHTISSDGGPINIYGGSGVFVIDAFEISAGDYCNVVYYGAAGLLTIRGARLVATGATAVNLAGGTSNLVRLSGCVLLTSSGSVAIDAANASTNVHILGGTLGNRANGSNVVPYGVSAWTAFTALT